MELADKQKAILEYLKKNKEGYFSNIAFAIGCNGKYAKYYLEDLERLKLVKRIEKKARLKIITLWKLNDDNEVRKSKPTTTAGK